MNIPWRPRNIGLAKLLGVELLDSFASFILDFVFVLYLTTEYHTSDQLTGILYAGFGCLVVFFGLVFGTIIDHYGVQNVLIIGSILSTAARLAFILSPTRQVAIFFLLTICPATAAITNPVIKLAVRRYTLQEEREQAFRLIYIIINIACIGSALVIGVSRFWFTLYCGWTPFGVHCDNSLARLFPRFFTSYFRIALLFGVLAGVIQILVAISLRNTPSASQAENNCFAIGVVVSSGVGAVMRHYGATFPKYFTREFGENAPYEMVLSINPAGAMPAGYVSMYACKQSLRCNTLPGHFIGTQVGTAISAASMFILAIETSVRACFLSITVFTIGETLWSPKMMEISVMAGHEGREGTAIAVAAVPKFLSRVVAGGMSGYLLSAFCPEEGFTHPKIMWFIIGVMASMTPLALYCFRHQLFTPELSVAVDGIHKDIEHIDNKYKHGNYNDDVLQPLSSLPTLIN